MTETAVPPVEQRVQLDREFNQLAWLLWLLGLLFSLYATWRLFQGETTGFPWLVAICHLTATILTGAGTGLALRLTDASGWGWATLSAFFAFLVGPVGVVLGVVCYLMARGQPTGMPLVEVVKAEMWITTAEDQTQDQLLPLDLHIREELQAEPFVDLLPYADVATAMAIVKRLTERGRKPDIQMLRQMTQDRRPEVYQAAIAQIDKLEGRFNARIYEISSELEAAPHRTELRLDLAKVYMEYRQSGLLEEELEEYYWELTLAMVVESMISRPQASGALTLDLARLLHEGGLIKEAAAVAEVGLKREPSNIPGQLLTLQAIVEEAQSEQDPSLFRAARKKALESGWAVRVPRKPAHHDTTFELAKFWFRGRGEKGA